MTLAELLHPLRYGTHKDRVLATLLYAETYEDTPYLKAGEIKNRLIQARAPGAKRANISQALATAGHLVHTPSRDRGAGLWELTDSGREHISNLLGLESTQPVRTHDVATLHQIVQNVSHDVVRSYVEEAVRCLEAGALRAGIVFLWAGAIRHLQEQALDSYSPHQVTSAIQKHDPKARPINSVQDFDQVKDKFVLLGLRELTLLDKGQWQTLQEGLDLRNRCGHPTSYTPRYNKAAGFVEDVVGICFP